VPEARHQDVRQGCQPGAIRFRGGFTVLSVPTAAAKDISTASPRAIPPSLSTFPEFSRLSIADIQQEVVAQGLVAEISGTTL
jgi:hypothetical protein